MELNYVAIGLATVAQFVVGSLWYMPLFGKIWGTMHGFDKLSKEAQTEAQKEMWPLLVIEFLGRLVTTVVLALFLFGLPDWNIWGIAFFLWLGFVAPTQIGGVLFGGTPNEWVRKKIAIMIGGSLVSLLVGVSVLRFFS